MSSPAIDAGIDSGERRMVDRGLVFGLPSLLLWPLAAGSLVLVAVLSVAHTVPGGSYEYAFELDHYLRFLEPRHLGVLAYSIAVSAAVAVIAVAIGFPFTWFISRLGHRAQVLWLVGLMCVLTLSEVLVAFAWQILLSRTIGISNLLVAVGLLDRAVSWQPSLGAVVVALVYLVLPYTFLLFYPPLSRLDRSLLEAATTMGAGPAAGFRTVILPVMRTPIIGAGILVFVYVLGAYVTPSQLGRPEHWTMSVYITDQATTAFNMPFASAMAVVLLAVCLGLVIATARLGRRG